MKITKSAILLFFVSNSILLFSQSFPVKIDLKCKGNILDAKFFPANTASPAPAVILLHGFPGNESSPLGMAEKLNKEGFNILVFNYQGSFASEGTFSFEDCIDNTGSALDLIYNQDFIAKYSIDTSRIVVCGYSFGGAIALESAIHNNKIRNIISVANDDHSVSIIKAATDIKFRKEYQQFVSKSFGPQGPFRGDLNAILDYNIENVERFDLLKNANEIKDRRIFFIVGWLDTTSLPEINTLPLFRKLLRLRANIAIKGFQSDHSFSNVSDELTTSIVNWINNLNVSIK
jgi:uncharacterized protein